MSSPKKRSPTKSSAIGRSAPSNSQTLDFSVVPSPVAVNNRLLLAPPDMIAWQLLPDDVVVVLKGSGRECWRGPVWPQRGSEPGTLSFPVGCAQIAAVGEKVRLAPVLPSAVPAVRAARWCDVSFVDVARSGIRVAASLLATLHARMIGCALPRSGLLWSYDGTNFMIVPTSPPGDDAGDETSLCVAASTCFRSHTTRRAAVPVASALGGLDKEYRTLSALVAESLFRPEQFAHHGLQPTRCVRRTRKEAGEGSADVGWRGMF